MIIKNDNSLNNKTTTQTSIKNSSTMSKILCFGNKSKNNNSDSNYRRDSIQSILIFKDKKIKNSETDGKRSPNYGNKIEISIKSKFAKETKIAISNIENIDSKKNIFKNVNENILNKMMTNGTKKTEILEINENENLESLADIFSKDFIKKIERKKNYKEKSKTFYRNLCLKLILSFKNFIALHNSNQSFNNITFTGDNSVTNNITNSVYNTIIQIPHIEKFLNVKEFSSNLNSPQNSGIENQINQNFVFNLNKCQISKNDSFEYKGLYGNLNKLSNIV